ncbi:hypothetical protein ACF068_09600 [Streptomyces sp. NPDC016309]|uniref:hypothetical protein n=1 Tax=Streptomyces sp. NPDC016309 TaxID=3364965 RepID=UPI00370353F6
MLLTALVLGGGATGRLVLGALFAVAGAAMEPAVRWAGGRGAGAGDDPAQECFRDHREPGGTERAAVHS